MSDLSAKSIAGHGDFLIYYITAYRWTVTTAISKEWLTYCLEQDL